MTVANWFSVLVNLRDPVYPRAGAGLLALKKIRSSCDQGASARGWSKILPKIRGSPGGTS